MKKYSSGTKHCYNIKHTPRDRPKGIAGAKIMRFMNKTQIEEAFNLGQIETVSRQLCQHGVKTKLERWEQEDGFHQELHYVHVGYNWRVHMHNGDVISLSMTEHH